MTCQRKRPPARVGANAAYLEAFGQLAGRYGNYSNGDPIAVATSHGIGTHRLPCPQCDKGPRDSALSVTVEANGKAVWFCHRCHWTGTTAKPSPHALKAKQRRNDALDVWREGVRNTLTGSVPKRWPPFTRDLRCTGEIYIFTGPQAWDCARLSRGRALALPAGHPPDAYRWPASSRVVCLFETTVLDGLTLSAGPYEDHARGCPVCTGRLHLAFLRAFAILLLNRWAAAAVEVYGGFDPVRFEPRAVRHAA